MDDKTRELLRSMEGRDGNGVPNAVCGINVFSTGEEPPVEVRSHVCRDGEVSFRIAPDGKSEIMLAFGSGTGYDFLQAADICREYDERMGEGEECAIHLSVAHSGEFSECLSAICRSWAYDAPSPEANRSGIRFFADTEHMFVVSLPERAETRALAQYLRF